MSTASSARRNTTIATPLRDAVLAWLTRTIAATAVEGEPTRVLIEKAFLMTVGAAPTFWMLETLDVAEFRANLTKKGIYIPSNMMLPLREFASSWTEQLPRCKVCGLPGIEVRRDRSGITVLDSGGHCIDEKCAGFLVRDATPTTRLSWITLTELPFDDTVDSTFGVHLALDEAGLRKKLHPSTLAALEAQDVSAWDWAAYLLHAGGADAFDVLPRPTAVWKLLAADLSEEPGLLTREVVKAKEQVVGHLARGAQVGVARRGSFVVPKLTGEAMKVLLAAMAAAFPRPSDLESLVRLGLNESLFAIVERAPLRDMIFNLISWAESRGHLGEFIEAAVAQNPGSPPLAAFLLDYPVYRR